MMAEQNQAPVIIRKEDLKELISYFSKFTYRTSDHNETVSGRGNLSDKN